MIVCPCFLVPACLVVLYRSLLTNESANSILFLILSMSNYLVNPDYLLCNLSLVYSFLTGRGEECLKRNLKESEAAIILVFFL
jgi:hypothetical protein